MREKGYKVETVPNGKEAVKRIPSLKPDLAVVNAASLRSSGLRVCRTLPGSFTYKSIFIGNHVYIGQNARLWAVESKIYIADKVVIGPQLVIMGGDHNIHEVGKYIIDIYNKEAENDKDVFIESDTWIGSNVTILKGVTIARGAVIGAGSVVTKSIPPYGIAAGNPAKVIKYRFSPEEIIKHESILYPKS